MADETTVFSTVQTIAEISSTAGPEVIVGDTVMTGRDRMLAAGMSQISRDFEAIRRIAAGNAAHALPALTQALEAAMRNMFLVLLDGPQA